MVGSLVVAWSAAPRPERAKVKLADSLGDGVWACLPHAEEILVTVLLLLSAEMVSIWSRAQQCQHPGHCPLRA